MRRPITRAIRWRYDRFRGLNEYSAISQLEMHDHMCRPKNRMPDGEEIKVGDGELRRWLRIEQVFADCWWLNIAGVNVNVTLDRGGGPLYVTVDAPYRGDELRGCAYRYDTDRPPVPWQERKP